eukprot:CAMPEP_0202959298 /NCGR_PEP_ID=MMETSP1396-20130829/3520_1 /ASSEMBLY_ACC=CAM_ASM_000872 /TAXON_ID= /ORGANISM="Pseudokeronopsis sp., Strain Brazil" /LENGTH=144 /DNA_ID=CAMNT_0049677793 /DNA_START=193 /DNA_END=627 /DNA_ORIENTATION=-
MMRFMGKKHGYYPEDDCVAWRVDSIIDALDDANECLIKVYFAPSEEEKKEAARVATTEVIPRFLSKINKILLENGNSDFLVGNKTTIADFFLGAWVYSLVRNPNNPKVDLLGGLLDAHPQVLKWADSFAKENESRLSSRPVKPY